MRAPAWSIALVLMTGSAGAATLTVVGLFPGKAVVSIDGGAPRAIAVGVTIDGYKLVEVASDRATFLVDGRRESFAMGTYLAGKSSNARATAMLSADTRGHYLADGAINGTAIRFIVDTGATLVTLSSADAIRLGIAYRQAPLAISNTANGPVPYRIVKLDRVKVGDVELTNIEAGVMETGYDGPPLLGMSFLSRTEVSRDGQSMVLTRRY